MMEMRKRPCLERLYGERGFVAVCIEPFGTEHSHHDLTAEEAVAREKAIRIRAAEKVAL